LWFHIWLPGIDEVTHAVRSFVSNVVRLASAKQRKALRDQEEREAEMLRQRLAYEAQTSRRQLQQTADLVVVCRQKLAETTAEQWRSKQVTPQPPSSDHQFAWALIT